MAFLSETDCIAIIREVRRKYASNETVWNALNEAIHAIEDAWNVEEQNYSRTISLEPQMMICDGVRKLNLINGGKSK